MEELQRTAQEAANSGAATSKSSKTYTKILLDVPQQIKDSKNPRWWCWWCCYSATTKCDLYRHYREHHPLYLEQEQQHFKAQKYRDSRHYLKAINENADIEMEDEFKSYEVKDGVIYICSKGQVYTVRSEAEYESLKREIGL